MENGNKTWYSTTAKPLLLPSLSTDKSTSMTHPANLKTCFNFLASTL